MSDRCGPADTPDVSPLAYFASSRSVGTYWPQGHTWLSSEENLRIARMIRPEDRSLRTAAHILKRGILGLLLGIPPRDLAFATEGNGRPILNPAVPGLDFNISHSSGWVALSVVRTNSPYARTGVDVEAQRPHIDWIQLSPDFLSAAEIAHMQSLCITESRRFALQYWCIKEAIVKATGEGLSTHLGTITPTVSTDGTFRHRDLHGYTISSSDNSAGAVAFSVCDFPRIMILREMGWVEEMSPATHTLRASQPGVINASRVCTTP